MVSIKMVAKLQFSFIFISSILFVGYSLQVFDQVPMDNNYYTKSLSPPTKTFYSVDFEVYGRVQGVYFRKHTQKRAKELGLNGWCMNTEKGSVQGVLEGPLEPISEMKKWLQYIGSPMSKIDRVDFKNEKQILSPLFKDFKIRR